MNDLKSYLFLAALETTVGLVQQHLPKSGGSVVKSSFVLLSKFLLG
ncbi:hypothetical protein LV83_04233 [Algoriphagus yeomjeoni]|uniref:Uncharacterized protein n=1 Tax=Algoriphagus yeomjeoni TaxID=291403 RepID=A0A327NWE9_9BACT|nr:hypothetical protein LV83_04233 [Algoriphagus yeomjeoni]